MTPSDREIHGRQLKPLSNLSKLVILTGGSEFHTSSQAFPNHPHPHSEVLDYNSYHPLVAVKFLARDDGVDRAKSVDGIRFGKRPRQVAITEWRLLQQH